MKARELAELLMQTPDAEVVMEDAELSAFLSSDEGESRTGYYQRASGVEVGYCCAWESEISFDMAFEVNPPEPRTDGIPAIRIMGANSEPRPRDLVRRRVASQAGAFAEFVTERKGPKPLDGPEGAKP